MLFDHLVRARQHVERNRQADLLGGSQIDDELELRGLFHRKIRRLDTLEDLIDVNGDAPVAVRESAP